MRKRYAVLLAVVLAGGGWTIADNMSHQDSKDADSNIQIATSYASYKRFASVNELEEEAELVVVGSFTGERELYFRDADNGGPGITLSKSTVEIEKVLKGNEQKKGTITVFEEGYIKAERYINTEGYKWMNEDGKYLLFLISNPFNDSYVIVGMHQGKYDLNLRKKPQLHVDSKQAFIDSNVEFMGKDHEFEAFYKLKEQAVKKYRFRSEYEKVGEVTTEIAVLYLRKGDRETALKYAEEAKSLLSNG